MRIQHNIPAMNAYRNYNSNTKSLQLNLQKLSSGYKINKAGDDAAGLAISEKMRAQITGLEVAQKNAKDGISLVQTAEGAMTEIHTMLNRMFSLAEQSANGTYDNDVDREQLNNEFDKLRTEIDRIAQATNFNGKKLLNGELDGPIPSGDTGAVKNLKAAVSGTNSANLGAISFTPAGTDEQKAALNEALKGKTLTATVAMNTGSAGDATPSQGDTITLSGDALTALGSYTVEYKDAAGDIWTQVPGGGALTIKNAGTPGTASGGPSKASPLELRIKDATGVVGTLSIGMPTSLAAAASNITFAEPGDSIKGAELDTANAATANNLANYGIDKIDFTGVTVEEGADVNAEWDGTNKKLIVSIGSDSYEYTATANAAGTQSPIELTKAGGTDKIKVTLAANQTIVDNTNGTDVASAKVGETKAGEGATQGAALRLRVGDSTESYDNIYVAVKSLRANGLADLTDKAKGGTGLTLDKLGIGYATKEDAAKAVADGVEGVTEDMNADTAMKALKGMINYVSNERGKLGATQNRLDHTINNLSTMQENIQDAEATIRDVDVAEEMMKYTKNNILVQSAQAMLAQANQLPQGVLQLLG